VDCKGYNHWVAKHVIHISELEAAAHFASLLADLRAGEEIIIEDDSKPVAVVHPVGPIRRTISECIALAKAREEKTGKAPVLDPDFADDMAEIIKRREAWKPPAWD
jgi:antitoxin (DNA-binding transcriptional repressor) of toxin-antitoxin stability system